MAPRKMRALQGVDDSRWPHAEQCISNSLRLEGDLAPLMAMASSDGIWGWGPAMASVILAACRPERFTVADTRALATVQTIGFEVPSGREFGFNHWEPYLAVCQRAAEQCGRSLRE